MDSVIVAISEQRSATQTDLPHPRLDRPLLIPPSARGKPSPPLSVKRSRNTWRGKKGPGLRPRIIRCFTWRACSRGSHCREVSSDTDRHLVHPPRINGDVICVFCRYLLLVLSGRASGCQPFQHARPDAAPAKGRRAPSISTLIAAEAQRLILHKLEIESGRRFLDQLFIQVERRFVYLLPVT